jgi:hypothetical protein
MKAIWSLSLLPITSQSDDAMVTVRSAAGPARRDGAGTVLMAACQVPRRLR